MAIADDSFEDRLLTLAVGAIANAYAPYSGFRVGAAIEDDAGGLWPGSNIEIAASGVSLCAERVALAGAVSSGARDFQRLVIACEDDEPITPCGVCRQTLIEFGRDLVVLSVGGAGKRFESTLARLLPDAFERRRRHQAGPLS